ncbi:MAG: FAD-dependent oxidoreductase [Chloroflexota bacterium]
MNRIMPHQKQPFRVVIVGGGFAGLSAAYTLRERLGAADRVTLISHSTHFVFAPSLVWTALGQWRRHSSFALEPALAAKNIEFIQDHVNEVRVADKCIVTDTREVPYDRLIIATGGRPDAQRIPGLAGEFRHASWIVGEDSAMEARNVLNDLYADPGPLVIGAAQGASYVSAAYELALTLDATLRRKGIRGRCPITFVTAEPYLGHLGLGQTAARDELEKLFQERGITYHTGTDIEQISRDEVRLASGETLPARVIIVMPPFTGDVDIWKSAGLTDNTGLIPVNAQYRHVEHDSVYAAGVAAYFREPIQPLGLARTPHTGYLSTRMGKLAAENVAASLGCGSPPARTLPRTLDVRVLDGGNTGVLLTSRANSPIHNRARRLPGPVAHYLKAALERYLVWRLRTGRIHLP